MRVVLPERSWREAILEERQSTVVYDGAKAVARTEAIRAVASVRERVVQLFK